MKKKGQSAMEYLMTYGWAILIVIVVVAALYAMGVFKVTPSVACSPCFGTSHFTYIDHNTTDLIVKVGPESIDIGGTQYQTGESANYDISTCAWTNNQCQVTVTYSLVSSGIQHQSAATLHSS